jgi:hypothetical protein
VEARADSPPAAKGDDGLGATPGSALSGEKRVDALVKSSVCLKEALGLDHFRVVASMFEMPAILNDLTSFRNEDATEPVVLGRWRPCSEIQGTKAQTHWHAASRIGWILAIAVLP